MSKETIRKIGESAKVVLGALAALAVIWSFQLPFDVDKVTQFIDWLLKFLASTVLAVSGIRGLRKS